MGLGNESGVLGMEEGCGTNWGGTVEARDWRGWAEEGYALGLGDSVVRYCDDR
jgi:hypothetical protein